MARKRSSSSESGPRNYKQWQRYGSPILSAEDLQARYSQYRQGISSVVPNDNDSPYLRSAQLSKSKSIEIMVDFLARLLQTDPEGIEVIDGAPSSLRSGDLVLPNSINFEVKARAINPQRYPLNHVAVADLEFDPSSPYGMHDLARLLSLDFEDLANAVVREFSHNANDIARLGHREHLKVLIRPIATSTVTAYVNPKEGHIYLYKKEELLRLIAQAIRNSGFRKGQGGEFPNRLSVLVALPRWRFSLGRDQKWRYSGAVSHSKEAEKSALIHYLTGSK